MKDQILIAIDSGKSNTKAIASYKGNKYSIKFRTKMLQVEKNRFGAEIQPGSYLVDFNGKAILLGDMVDEANSDYSLSKTSLIHQISIYTAISQLLKKAKTPSNVVIKLALNLPITSFKDQLQKEKFKQLMENNKQTVYLLVNGQAYSFFLEDVTLAFEGMGEVYAKPEKYKHNNSIIIDIGSLNCTYCQFIGLQPQIDSMIVSDYGINKIKGVLRNIVNERYGVSVSSRDAELALRSGYFSNDGHTFEDSKLIIEELKLEHLKQIINNARSRGITFNMTDTIFVGGGSLTLKRYIKQEFPYAIIPDNPVYSNCYSFLKILEVKHA